MELKSLWFSAKTRIYKQNTRTYTQSGAENSISSLPDYYRTVFSVLSCGNESLVIFKHGQSGNYASSQAQSWIQISSTGKTSREHLDVLL